LNPSLKHHKEYFEKAVAHILAEKGDPDIDRTTEDQDMIERTAENILEYLYITIQYEHLDEDVNLQELQARTFKKIKQDLENHLSEVECKIESKKMVNDWLDRQF